MIYNGMQFLGVPLETIIKGFRTTAPDFDTVNQAAKAFLDHLYEYVEEAPEKELLKSILSVVGPVVNDITKTIRAAVEDVVMKRLREDSSSEGSDELEGRITETIEQIISKFEKQVENLKGGKFLERKNKKKQQARYKKLVSRAVESSMDGLTKSYIERIVLICVKVLRSTYISGSKTGLVFAGFGRCERFPTLVSFEIDGVFEARVKFLQTEHCDIDREGMRAFVCPFAQKEMVDRFLHGLDDRLRTDITKYCAETVGKISEGIFDSLDIADADDLKNLKQISSEAEKAFIRNLNDLAFNSVQEISRREIEDMVEFMPKPELAKMAEALIDLTSIKRKVSQGLETVGGPVDVAVISKNDGFVWVKRKHYFPSELNLRYISRNRILQNRNNGGQANE